MRNRRTNGGGGGVRHSRTSLSVLSPFDEQEEWLKILEILDACNDGLEAEGRGEGDDLLRDVQRELQNRFGKSISIRYRRFG